MRPSRRAHQLRNACENGGHAALCPPCGLPMDRDKFLALALRNPVNERIADELSDLARRDAGVVSGCLVQTVWNVRTTRAVDYGIADYDVFYFDPDTSWRAEDTVISGLQRRLAALRVSAEVRNPAQA